MTFTIELMPPTVGPHMNRIDRVAQAVLSEGRTAGADGMLQTADGLKFRLDGTSISLDALSPDMCRLIFEAAVKTNTYVSNGGSDLGPLMMKGAAGKPPTDLGRVRMIANPAALCVVLNRRLAEWLSVEKKMQADGIIGPDDEPLGPPADPGSEVRVAMESSDVATRCDKTIRFTYAKLGGNFKTVVVSQNPKWGVVWRADVSIRAYPDILSRETCWGRQGPDGKAGLSTSSQPLEMFDPKESIPPLKADEAAAK